MAETATIPLHQRKLIAGGRSAAGTHRIEQQSGRSAHCCRCFARPFGAHINIVRGGLAGRKQFSHPIRPGYEVSRGALSLGLIAASVYKSAYLVDVRKHKLH